MQTNHWEYSDLKFEGVSLAGVRTSLSLPKFSLCFDVAQGLPHALGMNTFFITHGHMDHAAGIPYVISQKAMNSHRPPRFIMPESMKKPMEEIMRQWSVIEGHDYHFEFTGAKARDEFSLRPDLYVKTFQTVHRVDSLGYSLYRRFRKLKPEFLNQSSEDIIQFKQRGEDPTEEKLELLVSFTGDTQIEFLDRSPEVVNSKILIMEATYLDQRKSIASAKEWGHTHLDEILQRLDTIKSERILLIHSSARYSFQEAKEVLRQRVPKADLDRVVLFPGR
jgi:ribonuclease Z